VNFGLIPSVLTFVGGLGYHELCSVCGEVGGNGGGFIWLYSQASYGCSISRPSENHTGLSDCSDFNAHNAKKFSSIVQGEANAVVMYFF
jgi:hypothetical protein